MLIVTNSELTARGSNLSGRREAELRDFYRVITTDSSIQLISEAKGGGLYMKSYRYIKYYSLPDFRITLNMDKFKNKKYLGQSILRKRDNQ